MNVFSATGNLGKDAETRHTANGDAVVSFSVAVKAGYGKNESTTWINCTLWGKRGESVAPYLLKGTQVAISGEISLREYDTKEGKRQSLDCRLNDVTLIGKPIAKHTDQKPSNSAKQAQSSAFDDLDSPPF